MPAQVQADLLGAPELFQSGLDESLESPAGCDFSGFRATGSVMSAQMSDDGLIGCVPGAVFGDSSRDTVEGDRPIRAAITRIDIS